MLGIRSTTAVFLFIALLMTVFPYASVEVRDLDGRVVDPFGLTAHAYVFIFVQTDCPISNRYIPEMSRLFQKYGQGEIRFFLIYVNPAETLDMIERHVEDFALELPVLLDPEHSLVRKAAASVTPESGVFSSSGDLLYRGRIDNRYFALGRARPEATRFDLEEVLLALQRGERPEFRETEAFGCFISDLR